MSYADGTGEDHCKNCGERVEPCNCRNNPAAPDQVARKACQGKIHGHGGHWCSDGWHVAR